MTASRFAAGVRRSLLFLLFAVTSHLAWAQAAPGDFSIVVLPDTQNYSQYYPQIFAAQTQWIAAQRDALNIQAVIGVGDIVNNGSSDTEWQNADAAVRTLDQAGVPYVMAIGNHDYELSAPQNRLATHFNQYFGPARYAGYAYFGATYPDGSNENFYATFTINGQSYLVLLLEFVPRNAALDWGRQVIAANPDKEIWLVTHSNMYGDNTRVDQCDTQDLNRDNDGEETWQSFASQYPNVSLVLSGHITQFTAHRTDVGANGNLVSQMLTNFQSGTNGGDGYLRILTFHPLTNSIDVQTYSPYLDSYLTDAANQFTLKWHADGIETGAPTINGKVRGARSGYAYDCAKLGDASISVSEGQLTSDSSGNFSVVLEPQEVQPVTITASRPGYYTASQTVSAYTGYPAEADLFLQPLAGKLLGRITDASTGAVIAGATVAFTGGANIGYTRTLTTSTAGDYSASGVPVGDYQLTVSAPNYTTGTATATVPENGSVVANVLLQPSTPPPPPPPSSCSATGNGVTICTPASGSTTPSPVSVNAAAQSTAPIRYMQVYVDGILQQTVNGGTLSLSLTMSDGTHRMTIQAKDANGLLMKTSQNFTVGMAAAASCTPAGTGVTICSPAAGSTAQSPVAVSAAAHSSVPISYIQVYVDGINQKTVSGGSINVPITMASGTHRLTVQAKDTSGVILKSSQYVTVP